MGNVGFELIGLSIHHCLVDIIFHDLISPYLDCESQPLVTLIALPFQNPPLAQLDQVLFIMIISPMVHADPPWMSIYHHYHHHYQCDGIQ